MSLLSPAPPQNVDFLCCGGYKRELRQLRAERKAFEEASAPAPPALRVSTHDLLLRLMCLAAHTAPCLSAGARRRPQFAVSGRHEGQLADDQMIG